MYLRAFSLIMAMPLALSGQQRLDVELRPRFGSRPLAFDTIALETSSGQSVSVTRCDLLLTGAALRREDGSWLGSDTWAAFIGARGGLDRFALTGLPAGKYTRLRFNVGVPPALNGSDPAKYPAGHALNPTVNGMHWGWQGGYIFAAIEGMCRSNGAGNGGYSFHLANDGNLATVELPLVLDLSRDHSLRLGFDLRTVFDDIVIAEGEATTHSRPGDTLAASLRGNLSRAFSVEGLSATPTRSEAAAQVKALIAEDATPFRLRFSSSLPRPSLPLDNPLTEEGVRLGERLFHDNRLSGNDTQSCASCHQRRDFFTDDRRFSIGAFGDRGTRQSMPLFNLAWKSSFFWDGRAPTLRAQSLEPILNPVEMHASLPRVVTKIGKGEHYPDMFRDAFGSPEVDADRIARALEQYLLTLVSDDSKFDRAMHGEAELSEQEQHGAMLFNSEYDPARGIRGADCFHCHGGPLFQSAAFANNGLKLQPKDNGRRDVTKVRGDEGKFAVPSLRNVASTAPYMHDGRFSTLEEVIDHYDHGVESSATLDPNLAKHPREGLRLTPEEKSALVAFLKTLTDHDFVRPPPPPRGHPGPPPPPAS